ncbi:S1 RNA-binding domain-containing protein [Micropruina sonneratiae]|uniref:S1 RNA-binding domain-containing protein n=1 Tax=Micropruina sonneratiae TaxID=2986940 RepID=UPI00222740D6|nr:S1 RNA-binding domain-containing protein [Micropruina sp. KQZ13P-5]MCW3159473.1 S1 RNA-binding domain-containing protein [Micropruina sp. KQZ13P-5]
MWSQPATPKQIAALKAHGNHDGKYYSKGRAGQTIGESVRSNRTTTGSLIRVMGGQQPPLTRGDFVDQDVIEHARWALERVSYPEATITAAAAEHDFAANKKGLPMNQLARVSTSSVASFVAMSTKVATGVVPFDYIQELETMHMTAVFDQVGGDPRQLHNLERAWAIAKIYLSKEFAQAENELIAILREAPSGTFACPETIAQEVLRSACSADLEKALLYKAHQDQGASRSNQVFDLLRGSSRSSQVIDVLYTEVRHRVEMAKIIAHGMVDVAKIKAAVPPAKSTGYRPCWGEVTRVKPSLGAFITLPSGETGLLHVKEMAPLNGGQRVEDATVLFNVGQTIYVQVTGKRPDGKLDFAWRPRPDSRQVRQYHQEPRSNHAKLDRPIW